MIAFLQFLGSQVAKAVTKPFSVNDGDENTWSDISTKEFDVNAKPHYALLEALKFMIFLRLFIANLSIRFGHISLLLMKEYHKSRELK